MTAAAIAQALGRQPSGLRQLTGGLLGPIYEMQDERLGRCVVKTAGPDGGLGIEGWMLSYLRDHADFPVPAVHYGDEQLLIMDYIAGRGRLNARAQAHAGELLAALHNVTADRFGLERDTTIGRLPQPNPQMPSWCQFFREARLRHMAQAAYREERLDHILLARVEALAADLERFIPDDVTPSLIHGDMWTGNVIPAGGQIAGFIDPAIYYADPEVELAFSTLFGTFGDSFFRRYHEIRPIRPGFFEQRLELYNLYPLLVHVRHFGGGYVADVQRTLARFGY